MDIHDLIFDPLLSFLYFLVDSKESHGQKFKEAQETTGERIWKT